MISSRVRGLFVRLVIAVVLTGVFAGHVRGDFKLNVVSQIERYLYDVRLRMGIDGEPRQSVVIVDIDEKSIAELGHWPWPRDTMASLVDTLFDEYGVRVLGVDIVFAEAYDQSALKVIDSLQAQLPELTDSQKLMFEQQRERWNTDDVFAASLIGREAVLGYVFKEYVAPNDPVGTGLLPAPLFTEAQLEGLSIPFIEAAGYVGAYDPHMLAADTAGYFSNPSVDKDGIFRRVAMMQGYEGNLYSSLALEVSRRALGNPPVQFVFSDPENSKLDGINLEGLQLADRFIPVDERLNALVPYQGPAGTFTYISLVDVLNGDADIEVLFDSIALIGTSAPGLLDLRATPVGALFIGVEIHANLIHGILNGGMKQSPQYLQGLEVAILVLMALLVSLITMRPAFQAVLAVAALVVAVFYIGVLGWSKYDLDAPVAATMLQVVFIFLLQFAYSFAVESRKKRHLSKVFGQYIPEELVADLNRSEEEVSLEGENREMSVLFSDVRGFTTISEGLDPVELTQLMNDFLTPITKVIHEHRGTIDKYMGDAVMAFWGAPLRDERHAYNSVTAGLRMIDALEELQPHFKSKGWPEIKVGVGANTGPMNVGNMGSEFRMAYTVLGDTVNLGSRLEGLTKQYGVQFIVSESTAQEAPEYLYRELDAVRVKGKNEPVTIVEPVTLVEEASAELLEQLKDWDKALIAYRQQDWGNARALIAALQAQDAGRMIYDIYLKRIEHFEANPPGSDWDGVFTHTSK